MNVRAVFANGAWVRLLAYAGLFAAFVHLLCFRADPTGTFDGIDWQRRRGHTDHVAHVGEARAFGTFGLTIWKVPAEQLFRRLTPEEIAALPPDVQAHTRIFPKDTHFVPGYAPDRPLVMNFAHVPRVYPPGVFLFGAPPALLYHYGLISFGASNRVFLGLLALSWFALVIAWTSSWRSSPPSIVRQLLTAVIAGYSWYWTMEGFYDVGAVAFAAVGLEAARRERFGLACLLCGLTVIVHPRLLMLAPLFGAVFWFAGRAWPRLDVPQKIAGVTGALLFAGGLAYALIIQNVVSLHALAQPLSPARPGAQPFFLIYAATLVTLVSLLLRRRSWLDAAVVTFGALAFSSQRYLAPWYWLPMLPWAMAPALREHGRLEPLSRTAAAARVLVVALLFVASNVQRW
ncbi:MAG TPA: glycosyltransferase family 87 protein [Polyangiaceae bacterium]